MMISFDVGGYRFNHRTAGVLIDEGYVLLHRLANGKYWFLPGGRVELGEDSKTALVREMQEEVGLDVEAGRLLWVVENYFQLDGQPFHEVGFYYELTFDKAHPICQKDIEHHGDELGETLHYKWFRLEDLDDVQLVPAFLKTKLQNIAAYPEHVVFREDAST
ncbi:NUDIX hydrolase [Tumebacillus sp. BK434]|uniref:NUDIX hydrolase n=1 Tax=Tumebacillus sp. BK434 TaxID=2512169 RepID=UPI001404A9AE|nr:NUDIX hydrolase [Tumebacillus sp. BK434]